MRPASQVPVRSILVATLVAFSAAWILSQSEAFRLLDFKGLDWMTRLRTHFQPPPDPRIAMVLFDDDSESRIAAWPTDRQWHADFMRLLYRTSPAEVCWDVIFDADGKSKDGDASMAAIAGALRENGVPVICAAMSSNDPAAVSPSPSEGPTRPFTHVVGNLAALEGHARAFLPFAALRASTLFAFADSSPEADGVRRRIPLLVRVDGNVYPTLGLQAALTLLKVRPDDVRVDLGHAITFKAQGRDWRIPPRPHPTRARWST